MRRLVNAAVKTGVRVKRFAVLSVEVLQEVSDVLETVLVDGLSNRSLSPWSAG